MSEKHEKFVTGKGSPGSDLGAADFRPIVEEALSRVPAGSRVLAIVSDKTRDDNTPDLFPITAEVLAARGIAKLDALIAQGTHSAMTEGEKLAKIGAKKLH